MSLPKTNKVKAQPVKSSKLTELVVAVTDLAKLDAAQLFNQYDIRINENGSVFDNIDCRTYRNVAEWAKTHMQNDGNVTFQKRQQSSLSDNW